MAGRGPLVPVDQIARTIHVIRGHRVMLDADLAGIDGVSTKQLNRAVKRNRHRFPDDFMFHLTQDEHTNLRSQLATSRRGQTGILRRARL